MTNVAETIISGTNRHKQQISLKEMSEKDEEAASNRRIFGGKTARQLIENIGENWKLETCLKRYQGFSTEYLEEL